MTIFLPVAGIDINLFLLIGVGAFVGFVQGLLGSGGFLLTPLLIMMGVNPAVATASGINAIVGASVSGTYTHLKAGHVDVKMGLLMLAGGVAGGGIGTILVKILRAMGNLDVVIILCYVVFMAVIGVIMFVEGLSSRVKGEEGSRGSSAVLKWMGRMPFQMHFKVSDVETSALAPLFLGGFVGILAAVMGVGGGFFLIPAMTFLLDMPMQVVVGTVLFQMLFTSGSVTFMQAAVNHNVDAILAAVLLVGSTLGAQMGARLVRRLKADQLKVAFSLMVMAMSIKMLNDLLVSPAFFLVELGARR
ncbi:MAG: sulfite exporter TauE/SafE family protein [Acidobacteriota bacterium]|jgi:uncharacterized protein